MGTENISEVAALALASPSCQQVSQILIFHQNDTTMSKCHLFNFLVNSSSHSNVILFTCVVVQKIWLKLCFPQVALVAQVFTLVNSKQSFVASCSEPFFVIFLRLTCIRGFHFQTKKLGNEETLWPYNQLCVSARGWMSGEVDYEALPEGASTGATLIAG